MLGLSEYKVGDWVYHDFLLKRVKRIDNGIMEVSDGHFTTCGYGIHEGCFPLDMDVKTVSKEFESAYNTIHEKGSSGLNYPDIKRWLVDHWIATVNDGRQDADTYQPNYQKLYKFRDAMIEHGDADSGYGFKLFYKRGR